MMAAKNKPLGAKDKNRDSKSKPKEKSQGQPKAEITVVLTEKQAGRFLKNAKVVTATELARQGGVKISAANRYLKQATAEGKMVRVGGYSGHWLYQPVSS